METRITEWDIMHAKHEAARLAACQLAVSDPLQDGDRVSYCGEPGTVRYVNTNGFAFVAFDNGKSWTERRDKLERI